MQKTKEREIQRKCLLPFQLHVNTELGVSTLSQLEKENVAISTKHR